MGWGSKPCLRPFATMLQAFTTTLPLTGCLLAGNNPDPALDIPAAYDGFSHRSAAAEAALPPLDWWRAFRSPELTAVIEEARRSNLDIAAAIARIVQADAQARITGAVLLPTVDFTSSASHARSSQTITSGASGGFGRSERDDLSAALSASYEIDFWARTVRRCARPRKARLRAAMTVKSSRSAPWFLPPTRIFNCWPRRTGSASPAIICKARAGFSIWSEHGAPLARPLISPSPSSKARWLICARPFRRSSKP